MIVKYIKSKKIMNVTIITSIIAAAAACLGALVPCLFSFLGKKKEYEIARLEQRYPSTNG